MFSGIVGGLQPILGAVEGAVRSVFRARASERGKARREGVQHPVGLVESNPGADLPLDLGIDHLIDDGHGSGVIPVGVQLR